VKYAHVIVVRNGKVYLTDDRFDNMALMLKSNGIDGAAALHFPAVKRILEQIEDYERRNKPMDAV